MKIRFWLYVLILLSKNNPSRVALTKIIIVVRLWNWSNYDTYNYIPTFKDYKNDMTHLGSIF